MNNIKLYLPLLIIVLSIFVSCSNDSVSDKKEIIVETAKDVNESELLIDLINKSGDFINSKKMPPVIKAVDVYDNLGKYLIIDIRNYDNYIDGHIDGSVNVSVKELINYMYTEANPGNYERVVIAGYSGQTASYYTSLLHLLGYGNVYSLRWGMSSWSKEIYPNKWSANVSNKLAGNLETKTNPKGENGSLPTLNTGETTGYGILKARVNRVAADGFKKGYIKIDKLIEEMGKYYIVSNWPEGDYTLGHLPGAINYKPKESLSINKSLTSLPIDKPIVLHCYSGHKSAFVSAYLRVLGYDAYTLLYGANSYMHEKMRTGIGHAYDPAKEVNDYPLVAGEIIVDKKITKNNNLKIDSLKVVIQKEK